MYLIALYLCHAYVSVWNSGLIGVTSLAGSCLSRVLSMENMRFASVFLYFPTKIDSSLLWGGGWGLHILECTRVVLSAFSASLSLSFSSSEKRIIILCLHMRVFFLLLVHWVLHHVLLPLVPLLHVLVLIRGWEWEGIPPESWNHRIFTVGRDLQGLSSPVPRIPPGTWECYPSALAALVPWVP